MVKFPRAYRFGLGERVTRQALDLQETLIAAGLRKGNQQQDYLAKTDTQLAQLRASLRLCRDLQLLNLGQYEHVAGRLVEIGRLLGGWQKSNIEMGQVAGGAGGARRLLEQ